ncbi:hypothetical protein L873DRAFT_1799798 [Choiromyces venosus 120613-1]|uniref:Uncharacterized protein n=1 Tax=Choiromyces venosus 120613-1 TaxID=1336337 RepID=A0A3N4ISX2_9PEZI|nr:hypothetical protein L873DRAFT_1823816 [Choiromyces venosus 120613-1]RPB04300.1 hypothetical protein L873DRAFT_1799798 [Choiromyces venosus 120613-1]
MRSNYSISYGSFMSNSHKSRSHPMSSLDYRPEGFYHRLLHLSFSLSHLHVLLFVTRHILTLLIIMIPK